ACPTGAPVVSGPADRGDEERPLDSVRRTGSRRHGRPGDRRAGAPRTRREIMNRILTVMMMCCVAAPLAAQDASVDASAAASETATFAGDAGQIQKPAPAPPTPEHTGIKAMFRALGTDIRHLPSKENLFWAGVGGGTAAAVHPLDSTANQDL